jgi:hypothetical protein
MKHLIIALSLLLIPVVTLAEAPPEKWKIFTTDKEMGDYFEVIVQKSSRNYTVFFKQYFAGQLSDNVVRIDAKKGSVEDAIIQNCISLAVASKATPSGQFFLLNDTADRNGLLCASR